MFYFNSCKASGSCKGAAGGHPVFPKADFRSSFSQGAPRTTSHGHGRVGKQADKALPHTSPAQRFWRIPLLTPCFCNFIPSSTSLTWARKAPLEYHLKLHRTRSRNQGHPGQPSDESPGLGPNIPGKVHVPINQLIKHQCHIKHTGDTETDFKWRC